MVTAEQKRELELLPALRVAENDWRETEMLIARENVTAIEFGDDQIPSTAADWKAYWLALRAWKDGGNSEFPEQSSRPVRPK